MRRPLDPFSIGNGLRDPRSARGTKYLGLTVEAMAGETTFLSDALFPVENDAMAARRAELSRDSDDVCLIKCWILFICGLLYWLVQQASSKVKF